MVSDASVADELDNDVHMHWLLAQCMIEMKHVKHRKLIFSLICDQPMSITKDMTEFGEEIFIGAWSVVEIRWLI